MWGGGGLCMQGPRILSLNAWKEISNEKRDKGPGDNMQPHSQRGAKTYTVAMVTYTVGGVFFFFLHANAVI